MQKMKSGLMMFCLTVLLSCAALMMNAPTADAMGLADLQGDYRVVGTAKWLRDRGANNTGLIISWVYEGGEYLGKIKTIPQGVDSNLLEPGDMLASGENRHYGSGDFRQSQSKQNSQSILRLRYT